jgi:hypothetical protein
MLALLTDPEVVGKILRHPSLPVCAPAPTAASSGEGPGIVEARPVSSGASRPENGARTGVEAAKRLSHD